MYIQTRFLLAHKDWETRGFWPINSNQLYFLIFPNNVLLMGGGRGGGCIWRKVRLGRGVLLLLEIDKSLGWGGEHIHRQVGRGLYALYMVVSRRLGRKKKGGKDAVVLEYKKKTDQANSEGWRGAGWCLLRTERSRIYRHWVLSAKRVGSLCKQE